MSPRGTCSARFFDRPMRRPRRARGAARSSSRPTTPKRGSISATSIASAAIREPLDANTSARSPRRRSTPGFSTTWGSRSRLPASATAPRRATSGCSRRIPSIRTRSATSRARSSSARRTGNRRSPTSGCSRYAATSPRPSGCAAASRSSAWAISSPRRLRSGRLRGSRRTTRGSSRTSAPCASSSSATPTRSRRGCACSSCGPKAPYALSMLAFGRQHRCDWRGLSELHARINRLLEDGRRDDGGPGQSVQPAHDADFGGGAAARGRAMGARDRPVVSRGETVVGARARRAVACRFRLIGLSRASDGATCRSPTGRASIAIASRPSRTGFAPPTPVPSGSASRARSITSPT